MYAIGPLYCGCMVQMVALILSDVIGDPLDTIASGPTTPSNTTHNDIIALFQKYNLFPSLPKSIRDILANHRSSLDIPLERVPVENGSYKHVQNVIVGSSKVATGAAARRAEALGYTPVVWSHSVEGEARLVGEVYAALAHSIANFGLKSAVMELRRTQCFVTLTQSNPAMVGDFDNLDRELCEIGKRLGRPCDMCLISGGEPTVTVVGEGRGGRNQELALAFSLCHHQLEKTGESNLTCETECVLLSLGTDGQDGPTDAAGAMGHYSLTHTAIEQGLDGADYLKRNDSNSFFSRLDGGRYLVKTGLTGTNVMDIHCLIFTNVH